MDCLHASELLSRAHDGDLVDAAELAGAHVHCATCASCATFAATLKRLATAPVPRAPDATVELALARALADARSMREHAEAQQAAALMASAAPTRRKRRWLPERLEWSGRFGPATIAAAAVVVLAVGVTAALVFRPRATAPDSAPELAALDADEVYGTMSDTATAETALSAERAAGAAVPATATAPAYISLDGDVYLLDGPAVETSALTTEGVIVSDLGLEEGIAERTAYRTASDGDALLVRLPDDTYLRFSPVLRTHGQAPYILQTGTPVTTFGMWPNLPLVYAPPEAPDGSPTFQLIGLDDLGVTIYATPTGRTATGIAVAPGTAPGDPAAGNPNWTWWAPYAR